MVEATKKTKTKRTPSKPTHTNLSHKTADIRAVPRSKKFPFQFTTDAKIAQAMPAVHTDPILNYLAQNADKHFTPKMVLGKNDWLAC